MRRLVAILAFVMVGLSGATLWLTRGDAPTGMEALSPAAGAAEAVQKQASVGGAFSLIDQDGKAVTDADFRGKYMLVFFGFTHCPDICPTALGMLTQALPQLGDKQKEIVPVFITVDPARDTPQIMKQYLKAFDPSIIGLTGSEAQTKAASNAYKVYVDLPEAAHDAGHAEHKSYMVGHSGYIYLMDRQGSFMRVFSSSASPSEVAKGVLDGMQ